MAFKLGKWSGWRSPYKKWAFKGKVHKTGHGDLIQADRNKTELYIEDVPISQQNKLQQHIHDSTKQNSLLTKIFKGKLGDARIFGGRGIRNIRRSTRPADEASV